MKGFLSAIAGVLIILLGCQKEKPCEPALIIPAFIGKNQSDLRDFTVFKYQADSFPNAFIDSFKVHESVGITWQAQGDTLNAFPRTKALSIESGYDYLIRLYHTTVLGGSDSIIIRNTKTENKTIKCKSSFGKSDDECTCMNRLLSCTVNDSLHAGFKSISDSQGDFRQGYQVLIQP